MFRDQRVILSAILIAGLGAGPAACRSETAQEPPDEPMGVASEAAEPVAGAAQSAASEGLASSPTARVEPAAPAVPAVPPAHPAAPEVPAAPEEPAAAQGSVAVAPPAERAPLSPECQRHLECAPFWVAVTAAAGRDQSDAEYVRRGLELEALANDPARCRSQLQIALDMAELLEMEIPAECRQ